MTSLFVEDTSGAFESTPIGSHLARCYRVIDIGTQKAEFQGEVKYLHKVMLGWEIHGTNEDGTPIKMRDGRPFAMFKNYTLSWSDKATLRIDLQAWRGRPFTAEEMRRFDLKTILGAWCMLNVIERTGTDNKTYVNVANISPVPAMIKQSGLPAAINENQIFSLDDPDMDIFNGFSENLKKKIQSAPEWQKALSKYGEEYAKNEAASANSSLPDAVDDIPF